MQDLDFWLGLYFAKGIGPKTFRRLLVRFGDPEAIIRAGEKELTKVYGVGPKTAHLIRSINLKKVSREVRSQIDEDIKILTLNDECYPENLRSIEDAPVVLFQKGSYREADRKSIAVVGSRNCSPEGEKIAFDLATKLAKHGYTVASGLAKGIDTSAHKGALHCGGRTLAVLGSGINFIHPSENGELARRIIRSGAIFSELKPYTPPSGTTLMARDRITSGLSLGVIVVEANPKSGSIDTAKRAWEQNRTVYVVDIDSEGNRILFKNGAIPLNPTDFDFSTLSKSIEETTHRKSSSGQSQLRLF